MITNFSSQCHEKLRPPGGAPGWLFLLNGCFSSNLKGAWEGWVVGACLLQLVVFDVNAHHAMALGAALWLSPV